MIEQTILILKNEGDYEDWLLMLLISRNYLYPSTLILIRFEDIGTNKDVQRLKKNNYQCKSNVWGNQCWWWDFWSCAWA